MRAINKGRVSGIPASDCPRGRGIRSPSQNWWACIRRQDGRRVGPVPRINHHRRLRVGSWHPTCRSSGPTNLDDRSQNTRECVVAAMTTRSPAPKGDARYDRCQSEAEIRRGRRSRDAATISEADIRGEREQPQSRREQHVQAVDSCLHWFACAKEFQATSTTLMPRVARNRRHSSHTARASRRKLVIGGKSARVGGGGGNRTAD